MASTVALARYAESATRLGVFRAFPASGKGIGLASSVPRADDVPEISRFHGIVIAMYHNEHGLPHFHATHGGYEVSVEIGSGRVRGNLPPRIRRLVGAWLRQHRSELLDNWNRARSRRALRAVAPLE